MCDFALHCRQPQKRQGQQATAPMRGFRCRADGRPDREKDGPPSKGSPCFVNAYAASCICSAGMVPVCGCSRCR